MTEMNFYQFLHGWNVWKNTIDFDDLKPHWENLSAIDGPCAKGIYVRCSPIKLGIKNVTTFLSPCDAANVVTRHLSEWLQLHCCLWLWPAMPLSQCGLQYCVSRSFRFWESADVCLFGTRRIWNVTLQGCTTTCDAKACGSIGCAQSSAAISNAYRALQRNQRRRRTSKASRAVGKQKPRLQRTSRRTTCEFCKIPCIYHANENTRLWGLLWLLSRAPCLFLECLGLSWRFLFFKSASQALRVRLDRLVKCRVKLISGATAILCILLCQGTCTGAGTITLRQRQYKLMGSLITITYSIKYLSTSDCVIRATSLLTWLCLILCLGMFWWRIVWEHQSKTWAI